MTGIHYDWEGMIQAGVHYDWEGMIQAGVHCDRDTLSVVHYDWEGGGVCVFLEVVGG